MTATTCEPNVQTIPIAALRFFGQVRFGEFASRPIPAGAMAAKTEPDGDEADLPPQPVDVCLTLLSGEPLSHWYWGRCMFDFAGMRSHKPVYTLDYCHDEKEVVGTHDAPIAGEAGMTAAGRIIPFTDEDRAAEIIHRQAAGTPYECSITFDPQTCQVEWLGDDQVATVNGRLVEGPCAVFRAWDLRGAAICPQGSDKFAHAEFSAWCSISTLGPRTSPMTNALQLPQAAAGAASAPHAATTTPAALPAAAEAGQCAAPAGAAAASAVLPIASIADQARPYIATFGDVDGAAYFAAGKTMQEALLADRAKMAAQLAAAEQRIDGAGLAGASTDASGKLSFGEDRPLSTETGEADQHAPSPMQQRYGKNVGAFMAACAPPKK